MWRSVNGDGGRASPYRRLIALEVEARGAGEPPTAAQARASGVPPDSLEPWLLAILETWRDATPDSLVEPWDWYYLVGRTSRALSPRIPRERLAALNAAVWRALGADVDALRVHYDLDPREGKEPVAFTTFGGRTPIEPWVFATYRTGGLDNLNELLHETGHAVHIAAIRTRPAFRDWPDSDPFTEAVADFVALDVYEPAWQQRWLGDSVPLAEGLRSRYGGIVLDVAWAMFELRMLREPGADPNEVWAGLTRDYLRIRPHPELSWWAMRGPAGGRAGLHDELRGRRDPHRRHPRADPGGARPVPRGRCHLVRLGRTAALPLRPRAPHARGARGVPRWAGVAGGAAGGHAADAPGGSDRDLAIGAAVTFECMSTLAMIQLTADDIRLGVCVRDKTDAIRAAGALLVERGYIDPGYVASMVERETQANTFLGQRRRHPARPRQGSSAHTADRRRGPPAGGRGGLGTRAAGAARGRHRRAVGRAHRRAGRADRCARRPLALDAPGARDARGGRRGSADARDGCRHVGRGEVGSGTRQVEVRILGAAGLHARPATVFVGIAARFDAEIRVQYAGRTANGKALASLLTLGAGGGAALCILATGPDAEAALDALRAAVESGLGDEEAAGVPADAQVWSPPPGIHAVTGIAAAPGVAIGPLFQFRAARVVAADRQPAIRPRSATTWPRRWRPRASSWVTSTTRLPRGPARPRRPSSTPTRRCSGTRTSPPKSAR